MVTWYSEMLADVDSLLMLVDQIGAHDDRNRPYRDVAAELRADEFIPVQKAVADLANRVHSARETASVDEGIVYETTGLLVDLIPYMRYACRTGVNCEGGFGSLVASIDKVLGSMLMTIRSRMGVYGRNDGAAVVGARSGIPSRGRTWLTSDTHFGHENIVRYCGRPYRTIGQMDYDLARRWNERVAPDDVVYHLEDFAMGDPERWPEYRALERPHRIGMGKTMIADRTRSLIRWRWRTSSKTSGASASPAS